MEIAVSTNWGSVFGYSYEVIFWIHIGLSFYSCFEVEGSGMPTFGFDWRTLMSMRARLFGESNNNVALTVILPVAHNIAMAQLHPRLDVRAPKI